jgi:hypothetical protein
MILENNNSSNKERIAYIENKIKTEGVNSITPEDVIGIEVSDENGIPSFSDMMGFDYYEDRNNWKNKIAYIGDGIYIFNNEGKHKRIKYLDYDSKTGTIQKIDVLQRVIDYGDNIPKSGVITVVHGSPNGKIDNFKEEFWGKGYQQEELAHERFAGIYASDNTYFNKMFSGYGDSHLYQMKFNNSISEIDAEKILRMHEKEIEKRLSRIEATNFIKSLDFDMIYRDENDDTFTYICLDTKNIKPL